MITLLDIFKISEFQTAGDFYFSVGNMQCRVAISTPGQDLNLYRTLVQALLVEVVNNQYTTASKDLLENRLKDMKLY